MNALLKAAPEVATELPALMLGAGICPLCKRDGADPVTGRHRDCNAAMSEGQRAEILSNWQAGRARQA